MENENIKKGELVKVEEKGDKKKCSGLKMIISKIFKFAGKLIKKGNRNYLNIVKNGSDPIRINLTITVILFIAAFWAIFILLAAGLFLGYRYSLDGPDFKKDSFNDCLGKAADAAEDIKNDFMNGYKNA